LKSSSLKKINSSAIITIRCMGNLPNGDRCNRRLFDIRIDYSTPMRPHSIETVCPKCGAVNVVIIENNRIRVELPDSHFRKH
jgi:Zn finger protein HypA/HybF involved in hydrogenase expression